MTASPTSSLFAGRSRPTTTGSWSLDRAGRRLVQLAGGRLALEARLAGVVDGVVVVEQRHLVGVDVPLGRAGDLAEHRAVGQGVVEVPELTVEQVAVRLGAAELLDEVGVAGVASSVVIGGSMRYELRSPRMRTSGSPLPVGIGGEVVGQRPRRPGSRVTGQLPWPSPRSGSSGSPASPTQSEPFDLKWLIATVKRSSVPTCSNVWMRAGRLRRSMNRGSSDESSTAKSPTGSTDAGW